MSRAARTMAWLTWALLLCGMALAVLYGDSVLLLRDQLQDMGGTGVLLLALIQALWMMSTLPTAPVMTLAGVLYGLWPGALYVLCGNLLGSLACFAIGRALLRPNVERLIARHAKLRRTLRLIEARPVASLMLARVTSVFPLTLMGYALGTTRVSLRLYAVASLLGALPGVLLYVAVGHGLFRGLARAIQPWEIGLLGVLALAGVAWLVFRRCPAWRMVGHRRRGPSSSRPADQDSIGSSHSGTARW